MRSSWSEYGKVAGVPATLLVDAFGRLTPFPERVAPDPEFPQGVDGYLWSTFRNRSELMRWSVDESTEAPRLWNVEEAELTYHLEESQIGFAQVGLDVNPATPLLTGEELLSIGTEPPPGVDRSEGEWAPVPTLDDAGPPTDPVLAIPPLIQCLDDSLRWFGEADITAYQVTGYDLPPGQDGTFLSSVLGWFSVVIPTAVTPAIVTMASAQGSERLTAETFAGIQKSGMPFFEIGALLDAPAGYAAGLDWEWLQLERTDSGLAVSMPEWSTAAAGWLIASVFDAALALESAPQCLSVRVTRSQT